MKGQDRRNYYFTYTCIFAVMCVLVFAWFLMYGKSFVFGDTAGGGDGIAQHYAALVHYGAWLRQIVKTLIFDHRLEIPLFDTTIGLGADFVTTMNYYVLGDPLCLFSAVVPAAYTEYLYAALVILRIYLAGISFSCFCRYFKMDHFATLIGCLVYIFTSYTFFIGTLHPFFLNVMIYFPLILLGIERIYDKKSPILFIVMLAVSAMSSFYFCYMSVILMIIWAAFRYFLRFEKIRGREVFGWLAKFLVYSAMGFGISCILFLPSAMAIVGSSRVSGQDHVSFLYELSYYAKFAGAFIGGTPGYYIYWGFPGVALLAVITLFVLKKDRTNRFLKVGFVLLIVVALIPFAGHALNGFGYVTNRWCWAMAFLVGVIIARVLPHMSALSPKQKQYAVIVAIVYTGVVALNSQSRNERNMTPLCLFWITLTLVWFVVKGNDLTRSFRRLVLLCTCAGIWISAGYAYSPVEGNYIAKFVNTGEAYKEVQSSPGRLLTKTDADTDTARVDSVGYSQKGLIRNAAMVQNINGTSFYFSTVNKYISRYWRELYFNISYEQSWQGLDGRTMLNALSGSQYTVVETEKAKKLPYGYDTCVAEKGKDRLYYSESSLPFSYGYDSCISREEYESLTVTQRQQALLQGAVVERNDGLDLPKTQLAFSDHNISYQIEPGDNVEVSDGKITVHQDGSSIHLSFAGLSNSETYVIFEQLDFEGTPQPNKEKGKDPSSRYHTKPTKAYLTLKWEGGQTGLSYQNHKSSYYSGNDNRLCNLGYSQKGVDGVDITFDHAGVYSFDDLRVVCQPMDSFRDQTRQRKMVQLKNVEMLCNTVKGNVSTDKNTMLCITVPYSEGWIATVDGKETPVYQLNTMYCGIYLEPGEHTLQMNYETPYLRLGVLISLVSLGATMILWAVQQKRSKYSKSARGEKNVA